MGSTADVAVVNNPEQRRFETQVDGATAFLTYSRHGDRIILLHTEVPADLQNRGIAGKLARAALEFARTEHLQVDPRCSYVVSFIKRHPEYLEFVHPAQRAKVIGQ